MICRAERVATLNAWALFEAERAAWQLNKGGTAWRTVPRPYAFIVGSGDFLFPLPKLGRCAGINRLEANIYETSK